MPFIQKPQVEVRGNTIFYAPASDDSWPIAATQHEEASLAGLEGLRYATRDQKVADLTKE